MGFSVLRKHFYTCMTSLIWMSLPAAATAAGEVKQSQYKMAAYIEITLIDSETNESYTVGVNSEDAERARNDLVFATALLEQAKRRAYSGLAENITNSVISNTNNKEFDGNKENENSNCKEQHNWSKKETLLLMELYTAKEKDFSSGKRTVKQCWEDVSKEIKNLGYDISGQKCCIKFQAMKRTYKCIKDHNNKSGNNRKKWEYFDMMDKIFYKKPWIEPVAVAGTSVCDDPALLESSIEEVPKPGSSGIKRKQNMENYLEKLVKEKQLKREADNSNHREKMERLDTLNNLLQALIKKG